MSVSDDYAQVVAIIRGWGFQVREEGGCYGRSNGSGWSAGVPVGHINHHYVCSLNPDQGYINNLVANLANGDVVNWFADVHGVAYLIGTGPMNHAGTGNSSVLNLTRSDQPPPSFPASSAGDIGGNSHYSGTECQHPGDETPWPAPMLDVMVAINAAEALVWGWTANRAINHAEWSNRKIDMSAGGGVNSDGWAGEELRRRVAARMTGSNTSDDWLDEMSDAQYDELLSTQRETNRLLGILVGYPGQNEVENSVGVQVRGAGIGETVRLLGVLSGNPGADGSIENSVGVQVQGAMQNNVQRVQVVE